MRLRLRTARTFDGLDDRAKQQQQSEDPQDQVAKVQGDRQIGGNGGERACFFSQGDGHARRMGRIGEVDARLPFRGDRDGANRGVKPPLLKPAEDVFHTGDGRELIVPSQFLRHAPPQVHAYAGDSAVRAYSAVRCDVINCDTHRSGWMELHRKSSAGRQQEHGQNVQKKEE